MKRIMSLTLALALMAALFTGCGCSANVSDHPGGMITNSTTEPSIMPHPTATHATEPRETTLPRPTAPTGTTAEPTGENSMPTDVTRETTAPTDATLDPRARNRHTAR